MTAEKQRIFYFGGLLLLVTVLIFGQATQFSFVPYDDPAFVVENPYINQGLSGAGIKWALWFERIPGVTLREGVENLWHPLTWISHMIDVSLFGAEGAKGHHTVNILLHSLSGLLVFAFFRTFLGSDWKGFLVALLWLVHPLKVESVAWVSARKDVLSGVFFWASLCCVQQSFANSVRNWRIGGWLCFLLALLSKPSVVILPLLIVLLDGWNRGERTWGVSFLWNSLKRWWVWFLLAGLVAALTVILQADGSHQFFLDQSSFLRRGFLSGMGLWFYFWRMLVPWDLAFAYPQPEANQWVYVLAWLGIVALSFFIWTKRKTHPLLFVGGVWFVICWVPVSGFFYVGQSFTADRYLYLALAGPLLVLVHYFRNRVGVVALLVLALVWSGLSWKQTRVWQSGKTLFTHATKAQPRLGTGWSNLGGLYKREGDFLHAESLYQRALELEPNSYIAWHNLGAIHVQQERFDEAESAFQRSLSIYPHFLPALKEFAHLMKQQGRLEEAKALYRRGSQRDVVMLWSWCDIEIALGNFEQARILLNSLEELEVKNEFLLSEIARAKLFLEQTKVPTL